MSSPVIRRQNLFPPATPEPVTHDPDGALDAPWDEAVGSEPWEEPWEANQNESWVEREDHKEPQRSTSDGSSAQRIKSAQQGIEAPQSEMLGYTVRGSLLQQQEDEDEEAAIARWMAEEAGAVQDAAATGYAGGVEASSIEAAQPSTAATKQVAKKNGPTAASAVKITRNTAGPQVEETHEGQSNVQHVTRVVGDAKAVAMNLRVEGMAQEASQMDALVSKLQAQLPQTPSSVRKGGAIPPTTEQHEQPTVRSGAEPTPVQFPTPPPACPVTDLQPARAPNIRSAPIDQQPPGHDEQGNVRDAAQTSNCEAADQVFETDGVANDLFDAIDLNLDKEITAAEFKRACMGKRKETIRSWVAALGVSWQLVLRVLQDVPCDRKGSLGLESGGRVTRRHFMQLIRGIIAAQGGHGDKAPSSATLAEQNECSPSAPKLGRSFGSCPKTEHEAVSTPIQHNPKGPEGTERGPDLSPEKTLTPEQSKCLEEAEVLFGYRGSNLLPSAQGRRELAAEAANLQHLPSSARQILNTSVAPASLIDSVVSQGSSVLDSSRGATVERAQLQRAEEEVTRIRQLARERAEQVMKQVEGDEVSRRCSAAKHRAVEESRITEVEAAEESPQAALANHRAQVQVAEEAAADQAALQTLEAAAGAEDATLREQENDQGTEEEAVRQMRHQEQLDVQAKTAETELEAGEQEKCYKELMQIVTQREFMKCSLNDLDYEFEDDQKQEFLNELAQLTDELTDIIPVYEAQYEPLMFKGKQYLEIIQNDNRRRAKEEAAEVLREENEKEAARLRSEQKHDAAKHREQEEELLDLVMRREFMKFRLSEPPGSPAEHQQRVFLQELKRLTDQLTESLPAYEEEYGALVFQGKRYLEVIQEDHQLTASASPTTAQTAELDQVTREPEPVDPVTALGLIHRHTGHAGTEESNLTSFSGDSFEQDLKGFTPQLTAQPAGHEPLDRPLTESSVHKPLWCAERVVRPVTATSLFDPSWEVDDFDDCPNIQPNLVQHRGYGCTTTPVQSHSWDDAEDLPRISFGFGSPVWR